MADFTVADQLKNLSDEELEQLEKELRRKQIETESGGGLATTVGEGLLQGARGVLATSQGRALPGREKATTAKAGEDIETFEKKERIKAQIKQEFGGTGGGLKMVSLPGGGFAFIPGGQAKGNGEDVPAGVVGGTGEPQELENVKLNFGTLKGDVPKSERQLGREISEEQEKILGKDRATAVGKSTTAQRMGLQQIDLIANSARLFAETHVNAIKEGGMGSLGAQIQFKVSEFFGGEQFEKFEESDAVKGLKTEIISRLMPTLTQQGDKPGSVRLVQTIFAKLEMTIAGDKTPAKNARNMFKKTLTNAFNFARAAHRLGLTNEFIESVPDDQLESFSKKVKDLADSIVLDENEQEALNSLLGTALEPYNKFILERGDREAALNQRFGLN